MNHNNYEIQEVYSDLDHTVVRCDSDGTWLHCHHPQGPQIPVLQLEDDDGIAFCDGCGTKFTDKDEKVIMIPVIETPGIISWTLLRTEIGVFYD